MKSSNSQRHYKIQIPLKSDSLDDDLTLQKTLSPPAFPSLESKMKLLQDYGFDKDFNKKTRNSKICMADLWGNSGNKQKFLKLAGCVGAYAKMKELSKASEVRPNRSLVKPDKPHIMDMNTKRRLIFEDQRKSVNYLAPLVKITKSNPNSPRASHNVESRSLSDLLFPDISTSKSTPNSPRGSGIQGMPERLALPDSKGRKECYSSFSGFLKAEMLQQVEIRIKMEISHRPTPAEIQMSMPSEVLFEDYYGLTQFPKLQTQPPSQVKPAEKLLAKPASPSKVPKEEPPSPPSLPSNSESISPLKEREKEEDSWVTVKNRGKKKVQEGGSKFESLAEQQLNNSKSKKKGLKKKLKDIQELLKKQASGEKLDANQIAKIQSKKNLEKELAALG